MRGVLYLADGHHVDDAGNLFSCVYVDFRDTAERSPITSFQKASSKRCAIPGCETIRISKPSCFRCHQFARRRPLDRRAVRSRATSSATKRRCARGDAAAGRTQVIAFNSRGRSGRGTAVAWLSPLIGSSR